jgi:2-dehydropantoate 2-reductase
MDMTSPKKTRIAIAGIGGIGGYIGGKLAYYYSDIEDIEIVFIARGEMAGAIKQKGLNLVSKGVSYQCVPALTSDDPLVTGNVDIFIICTKTFSVTDILKKYTACITANTTVITTQNTVSGKETILPLLPEGATLMEGSIYIASNITAPGKVEQVSGPAKFFFGTDGVADSKGAKIVKIMADAGIDAAYTTDIKPVLWKKFMFVSPAAIVTAVFQTTFSGMLENKQAETLYSGLMAELMQLAKAKNIAFDENTIVNNINLLSNFKGEVKSSFQLDLQSNKPAEIESLVKYVIQEAKLYQVQVPNFDSSLTRLTNLYHSLA